MSETIDYKIILSRFPWIVEKNQNVILSPDCDGFLCGLLMSSFLGWKIVGFYDGKILILKKGLKTRDCVFLDMEIFRKDIRSVGHHMLMFDVRNLPSNWDNFNNCIQPNNIRGFDFRSSFNLKYPLGTIHFLIGILAQSVKIDIQEKAICPMLFVDGTFKNLFNFPENCLSWLHFLKADCLENPLHKIFYNNYYSVNELMVALKDLFQKLREINHGKRGGDKLKISNSRGDIQSFQYKGKFYALEDDKKVKIENLLKLLSGLTGWKYDSNDWQWNDMNSFIFSKSSIMPRKKNYYPLMDSNPLSYAITGTLSLEYTLEKPNNLP
ncbi:MAG: hypothetical protein PHR44_02430 [Candidatus Omnitrophica bacterium]|nr:hypothetical protein [Candidatus Omnitrophota bacterium]